MADILIHPADVEGDTEQDLRNAADFFISIGLLKEGDRFVVDQSASREDDEEAGPSERQSTCTQACKRAYDIAKAACNLSGNYKKCRKKAKKAYKACLALCDLTDS